MSRCYTGTFHIGDMNMVSPERLQLHMTDTVDLSGVGSTTRVFPAHFWVLFNFFLKRNPGVSGRRTTMRSQRPGNLQIVLSLERG